MFPTLRWLTSGCLRVLRFDVPHAGDAAEVAHEVVACVPYVVFP